MIGVGLSAVLSGGRKARVNLDPMPALDLDWATNRSLPASYGPTPSFSRASTGTFFNSSGVLTSAAVNVPRFDHVYSGGSWVSRGLLVEEQRTNLFTYSNTFSNGAWSKVRGTVTQSITSPDGTANAWQMDCNATGGGHYAYITPSGASTSGFYTISVFAKKGNNGLIALQLADTSYANYITQYFDLTNGVTTGTTTIVGNYSSASAAIADVGNGWYRCSLTANKGSGNGITASISFSNDSTAGFCTSGQYNYFFNAQLEFGGFATSAIVTTASSVTRSADVCQIAGSDFSNFYNQSEGAWVAEYDRSGVDDSKDSEVFQVTNSSGASQYYINARSGTEKAAFYISPTFQADLTLGSVKAAGAMAKLAVAYKVNDFAATRDGAAVSTDVSGTVPTVDRMGIGRDAVYGLYLNGHIARLRYYPTRLANATLQSFST